MLILDCLVEVLAPFDTSQAVAHVAETLKAYGCRSTMGDDHAKGWVRSELARHGITLEPRPPRMDGSVFHLEILPSFSSGRVRLLKNARAIAQYCVDWSGDRAVIANMLDMQQRERTTI